MKTKLFGLLTLFICFNVSSQTKYVTLRALESPTNLGICNDGNGAYFHLYSTIYELVKGTGREYYAYEMKDFYPDDSFGPRTEITSALYPACDGNRVKCKLVLLEDPRVTYDVVITLSVSRIYTYPPSYIAPIVPIHHYLQAGNGGDNFYTKDYSTLGDGIRYGLPYQGVAFKAHSEKSPNSIPIFRYFDQGRVNHFYSTDPSVSTYNSNYVYEGAEFYAYNYAFPGTVPVYLYYNSWLQNHSFSTSFIPYNSGGNSYQGIAFYAFPSNYQKSAFKTSKDDSSIENNNVVKTYPNPTKGQFTIENESQLIDSVQITDFLGKIVLEKNINDKKFEFDISDLSNGIYFAKVHSAGNTEILKIIKE